MAAPSPSRGPPAPEPALGEGALLSAIAGAVDGIGYLLLHVFTAHVTGNTVRGGTALGTGAIPTAVQGLLAVALFALGVAVGAVIRDGCERRGWRPRPAVLALSAALLGGFAWLGRGLAAPAAGHAAGRYALAALAAAAIGIGCSNAVMPRVGGRQVRTFITGTVVELVEALVAAAADRGTGRRAGLVRAGALAAVWVAYLAGATLSGWAGLRLGSAAALLPAAALAALAARAALRRSAPGQP
jgi:uncharacterized membrane protein YoaK (UPF0700 family)